MAEENLKVDDTTESKTVVAPTEKEQKAIEMGWRPKEEYEGDKRWVDAEEFLERQELYDGIHKANRKTKKLEKVIEALLVHNKKIEEVAVQKALDTLKQEKKAAAKDNDIEQVVILDEKIAELKENSKDTKPADSIVQEVWSEFKENNPWFDPDNAAYDEEMETYAQGVGTKLERANPDWAHEKLLSEVAKQTKKAFEHKFQNTNRRAPNKVSGKPADTTTPNKEEKITYNDLSPEGKSMYKVLVKNDKTNPHGVMSAEQYLADYMFALNSQKKRK